MPEALRRFTRRLTDDELRIAFEEAVFPEYLEQAVIRPGRKSPDISMFDALMKEFHQRRQGGTWTSPDDSDRWLAPRLHYSMRLTRREAADNGIWVWLLLRDHEYIDWRWGKSGEISHDRWYGTMNKQALSRLWWGAELFRAGSDYSPVERAFVLQDLINSLLHRPIVRCRPLAQGIVDLLVPPGGTPKSGDDVNDLARVLNLSTAGAPPEAETGRSREDVKAFAVWAQSPAGIVSDWTPLPSGPPTHDFSDEAHEAGLEVAERGWGFAHAAAEAAGTRSARRRAGTAGRDEAAVAD